MKTRNNRISSSEAKSSSKAFTELPNTRPVEMGSSSDILGIVAADSKQSGERVSNVNNRRITFGTVDGKNSAVRRRVVLQLDQKSLSNQSQREAWDHYLKHRPLRDETKDMPLGFDLNSNGEIIRDPVTGKPSSSCCSWHASVRTVGFHEFSDLGPGLGLTFRFMQVAGWFFLAVGLLSSIGWVVQVINPKNPLWVTLAWSTDMIFVSCFMVWMVWLRRDMVLHNDDIDAKDITSSDYAVKITGLPLDATATEVADYCSQFGELYKAAAPVPTNIYDNAFDRTGVSLVRNDSQFIKAAFDLVEVNEEIHSTAPENLKRQLPLVKKRKIIQAQYNVLRQKTYHCSGSAFVCFMYQDGADACRRGLRTGNFRYNVVQRRHSAHYRSDSISVSRSMADGGVNTAIRKMKTQQKTTQLFRNTIALHGEVAPNPSDILWKNLSNSNCNIWMRQLIINTLSFGYLFLLSIAMAYFAALAREYQNPMTHPPFNRGLFALLGNVTCCLTSIVLLMPIVSSFEGVHSRSTLEIITFLKLGFFQTMGVVVGTLYVYSLDEQAAEMSAFSPKQIAHVGSGLPTYNCQIPRFYFNTSDPHERLRPQGWEDVYDLEPRACFAFTLHLFGTGMGGYLIGTLIADLLLINMIDFLCPPWWIETMNAMKNAFQINLNTVYEGVDYKPFLRYQILLKFLMTAMFLSHIDNPRILYFWVAACFWQSLEIDRYCYVLRYRAPPLYSNQMITTVIVKCMPIALIIHGFMHVFFFAIDWHWTEEDGLLTTLEQRTGWLEVFMSALVIVFLFVWFLDLGFWRFGTHRDQANGKEHHIRYVILFYLSIHLHVLFINTLFFCLLECLK